MSDASRNSSVGTKRGLKRAALADRIADILLAEGVAVIPLRDLALRLGTSDRMLLYYFETQAALIGAALSRLSERLTSKLSDIASHGPIPPDLLLKEVGAVMAQPAVMRTLAVWADISARGARNEEPFRTFARASIGTWLGWLADRLDLPHEGHRKETAAAILVVIEGIRLIEASAPGSTEGVAEIFARGLESPGERR